MKKVFFWKILLLFIILLIIFSAGYYLRDYYPSHSSLPFSPYEAFRFGNVKNHFPPLQTDLFTQKYENYPVAGWLEKLISPLIGNFYIIYFLGGLVIFFFTKKISGNLYGALLALAAYSVGAENLIQYTRGLDASGLSYLFIWLALYFFYNYADNGHKKWLIGASLFSLLTIITYHTGGGALMITLTGIFIWQIITGRIDRSWIISFLSLTVFYYLYTLFYDLNTILLIRNSLLALSFKNVLIAVLILLGGFLIFEQIIKQLQAKRWGWLTSPWWPLLILPLAALMILTKINFAGWLLSLGVPNYFVSVVSLNNYLAQALLTGLYLILMLPWLSRKTSAKNDLFLGWILGLLLLCAFFFSQGYLARILDYSSPLAFIAFGWYWSETNAWRKFVPLVTLLLLFTSQIIIFHDPFSLRRYYQTAEMASAEKIIALRLPGVLASDLRTASLFYYLGVPNVRFSMAEKPLHQKIFYNCQKLQEVKINYVILSQNMRSIVYSTNFPTTPIDDNLLNCYDNNFSKIYDDGLMRVYQTRSFPVNARNPFTQKISNSYGIRPN